MIFDSLHHKSRVWVYISSKPLISYTKNNITYSFNDFKSSWKSHGEQLEGNLKFFKEKILIIGAQYLGSPMCGRSVDAHLRWINEINNDLDLYLLNRNNVAFSLNGNITIYHFNELDKLVENGTLNESTTYINSFITTNSEKIQLPFGESPFAEKYFSE